MYTIIRASQRYLSDYGSIKSHFLFSFSDYYDPNNMSWGDLRVFNDDFVASGAGFPTHPHKNFEIMTIMLEGTITHQDSLGNKEKVHKNEIQVTNTGSGISHSEFNEDTEDILLYQLWFIPKKLVAEPSYYTAQYTVADYTNTLYTLASGIEESKNKLISEITVQRGKFDAGKTLDIPFQKYLLLYVTSGKVQVGQDILGAKDQLRIQDEPSIQLDFLEESEILVVKSW